MVRVRRRERYWRAAGICTVAACVAGGLWAVAKLVGGGLSTSEQVAILGLLASLVPVVAGAVRLLRPTAEADPAQAAGHLAAGVESSEPVQRAQMLGGDNVPIDVTFFQRGAPSRVAEHAAAAGRLKEITDYYRRLRPRRLVITGVPGSGKTVLALELMLGLLEQRRPEDPVPVRLALAGWDTSRTLEEWLTAELAEVYRLDSVTARTLIAQRRVLPVLDGLDEMDSADVPAGSSRAAVALAALNAYQAGRIKAPLVLTCRTEQYEALTVGTRVLDAARVELEPVTASQVQAFVTARVADPRRWSAVLDAVACNPDGIVTQALASPWLLTLAITVYEASGDPAEILSLTAAKSLKDHLLDRFVPAAAELHTRAGNVAYRAVDVERWLAVLARYLDDNAHTSRTVGGQLLSGTDLVLHRLWPLAGRRTRVVDTVMTAAAALLAASILWGTIPIVSSSVRAVGTLIVVLLAGVLVLLQGTVSWPVPKGIDVTRLDGTAQRVAVVLPIGAGVSASVAAAFAIAFLQPPRAGPLGSSIAGYLAFFLPVGLVLGLAVGLRVNLDTPVPGNAAKGPRDLLRLDRQTGQAAGLGAGFAAGVAVAVQQGFSSSGGGLASAVLTGAIFAVIAGAGYAIAGGLLWAAAWRRYVAFLTCTRGRLPWRLGRFLDWAYGAGLLRISGTAYQFRHRELQDHLASCLPG